LRKIIFQNLISLDGFYEGPEHEIDWHNVDAEFNDIAISFLDTIDTLIFGRVTYELMAAYWPSPDALKNDPVVAGKMNGLSKIVFSRSLKEVNWGNTRLVKDDIENELKNLKQQSGKDIAIFGSSDLSLSLIEPKLIDEIRILLNPIILGAGKPIFKGINSRLKLRLLEAKPYSSGNVMLIYQPLY
jgi:dihydrofolate reductase